MTLDLSKKGNCMNCRHWQPFESNRMAGVCPLLGAFLIPKAGWPVEDMRTIDVSITHGDYLSGVVSDVKQVRTHQYFGCIHHHPKQEDNPT